MRLLSQNLQAFVSVVKRGTVHGAAADLRLTQTGVTQRIRSLETALETSLFLRSRKGMKLTQEGEALLRYCNGAEHLEGEVLSHLSGTGQTQPAFVNLAGPTSVLTARTVDQCSPLFTAYPNLFLNFIITDTDCLPMVRSGQATLAIVSPHAVPNEMDSKALKPDRYLLVASPKWKGRRMAEVLETEKVIDFYEGDLTSLNYLKKFDLQKSLKRPRLFVNNNDAIIQLFRWGVGFGTLTQEVAKPFLDKGELIALNGGAVMEDPLALVWYPRAEMPKYLRAIISAIR